MRTCPKCDGTMRSRRVARPYTEAGLGHVRLEGVEELVCEGCGNTVLRLPRIEALHRLIAVLFLFSVRRLIPAEFRFLRKYTGMSTSMLAARLGTEDDRVNAWEAGREPIPLRAELRLRYIVFKERPIERYDDFTPGRTREPKVAYRAKQKQWRRDGRAQAHA